MNGVLICLRLCFPSLLLRKTILFFEELQKFMLPRNLRTFVKVQIIQKENLLSLLKDFTNTLSSLYSHCRWFISVVDNFFMYLNYL